MIGRLWARLHHRRYGESMWTASGASFYPLDPRASEINLLDIARGLANRCRYQGQIGLGTGFFTYTVAEHSVLVSIFVEKLALDMGLSPEGARNAARVGLLHDASEAYIADVARPLKYSREMKGYRKIEARLERAIAEAFKLDRVTDEIHRLVKTIDNRILVDEIRAFMNTSRDDDYFVAKYGEPLECEIQGLRPALAEALFLWRYEELFA